MPTLATLKDGSGLSDRSAEIQSSHCHGADSLRGRVHIQRPTDESRGQLDTEDKLEPIAIVGMALKFPQDATSPETFWQTMMDGKSAKSDVPPDRFNINGFHRPVGTRIGQVRQSF